METIYRVQDKHGFGCYAGRIDIECAAWQDESHGELRRTPGLCDEVGHLRDFFFGMDLIDRQEWKCGFSSLDDLYRWFSPTELNLLYKMGFSIVKLEVSEVVHGYKQVIFKQ